MAKVGRPKRMKYKPRRTEGKFLISLEVNDQKLIAYGDSLGEALRNFPDFKPFTKGNFTISRDGKVSKSFSLAIPYLKRLFWDGMTGEIQRAQFEKRFTILS